MKSDFNKIHAQEHARIGLSYAQKGDLQKALIYFKRAHKAHPEHIQIMYFLGLTYQQIDQPNNAMKYYKRILKLQPDYAPAYNNIGYAYLERGEYDKAEKYVAKALKYDPESSIGHTNMGNIHVHRGNIIEARKMFEKAVSLDDKNAQAHNNLGILYYKTGEPDKAEKQFQEALAMQPNYPHALYHLGFIFIDKNRLLDALGCLEKSRSLLPSYHASLVVLADIYARLFEWDKAKKLCDKIDQLTKKELSEKKKTTEFPFFNLIRSQNSQTNLAVAQSWSKDITDSQKDILPFKHSYKKVPRKLKIGYISSDFGYHVISHHVFGLFKNHSRNDVEVYAYATNPLDVSEFSSFIKENVDVFRDITETSVQESAQHIYNDGIHILIDLMGHTRNNRIEILGLKPAPIQVSYLGFPGSTGAEFIDYIITDTTLTPPSSSADYSEKQVYMPTCYQVNSLRNYTKKPKRQHSRSKYNIPRQSIVFCSFNNSYKITQETCDAWTKILKAVPQSVLWLLGNNDDANNKLLNHAKKRGLDSKRIIFASRIPYADHLERLKLADIALDPFPYTGGATTCNALWSGLPVITLQGKTYSSRMSSSMLHALGLEQCITRTANTYVKTAVELAKDKKQLLKIKEQLLKDRSSHSFFDTKEFAHHLESAYKTMWKRYIMDKNPKSFHVQ